MSHARLSDAVAALRDLLGERCSTAEAVRAQHGADESFHEPRPPDVVVYPRGTDEVAAVARICTRHALPMIPFGAGTSLEGHVHAVDGGVCIATSQMTRLLQLNQDDLDCRVEAGLTRVGLAAHLKPTGLFFPVDPGADATLGGMVATGASGTTSVRYGTMRANVLGLTVVLADGAILRTGGRARKSSAGFDLTRLFVGSEGTLGIVTEVALRLHGVPEAIAAATCAFPTLEAAVEAASLTLQHGVPVARMELLDDVQMDAVNRYSGLEYEALPTLFFEFHGSGDSVREQSETVGELAADLGASGFAWATRPEDRTALWRARHEAYYAALALRPGSKGWATDVCVPISALADCIVRTRRDIDEAGLLAPIVGHVGDGNFHVLFILEPGDEEALARARAVNERMIHRALEAGGTCTGEHGIGLGKIPFLEAEHGDALPAMRAIKRALDPLGLLNPGKIFREA